MAFPRGKSPAPRPDTKEGVEFVITRIQAELAVEMLENGSVEPRAIIMHLAPGREDVHNLGEVRLGRFFNGPQGKDFAAMAIRDIAKRCDAYGVLFISESWMSTKLKHPDERNDLPDSMEDWPEDMRDEVITMTVDHKDYGQALLTAVIDRSSGKPMVGEFESAAKRYDMPGDMESSGRFVGFLHEERPDKVH